MAKLIIFDLDGTLADTEPLHIQSYLQAYREVAGVKVTPEQYISHVIIGGNPASLLVEEKFHDAVREYKRSLFAQLVRSNLSPMPGAVGILTSLSGSRPMVIVSSGDPASIAASLSKLKIRIYIDRVYSAVVDGKKRPKEELLVQAAKDFSARPEECVVIEDTLWGLKAAKAAGMKCIICPNQFTKELDYSAADLVVGSLTEISPEQLKNF